MTERKDQIEDKQTIETSTPPRLLPESEKTLLRPHKQSIHIEKPKDQNQAIKPEDFETVFIPKETALKTQNSSAQQANALPVNQNSKQIGPGTILKNRFDLLEEIGAGGMGIVYKALDRRDVEAGNSTFIAIKILHESYRSNEDILKALHSETRKTQQLAHPNIITVYDFDRDDDAVFMTMEYIEGVPLSQVIKANPNGLPITEALAIIDQLAQALAYAHSQHVVHSDFKPGNIFIDRSNHVKVLDFGIARMGNMARVRGFDAGVLGGMTPTYASLEMIKEESPDPRDDIYGLACVAYELLSGQHPFNRENAENAYKKSLKPQAIANLDAAQWKSLKKALAFHRADRTENVSELVKGLHNKSNTALYVFSFIGCIVLAAIFWMTNLTPKEKLQDLGGQVDGYQNNGLPVKEDKSATDIVTLQPNNAKFESRDSDTVNNNDKLQAEPNELILADELIKIKLKKDTFQLGEQMQVEFTVEKPLYVSLFIINSRGETFNFFPNAYQEDNFCKPGLVYQIPPKNSELTITITEPRGMDKMVAVGAMNPFSADDLTFSKAGKLIPNQESKNYTVSEINYIIE